MQDEGRGAAFLGRTKLGVFLDRAPRLPIVRCRSGEQPRGRGGQQLRYAVCNTAFREHDAGETLLD